MKMKWALNELTKYEVEPLKLSGEVDLSKELKERSDEVIEAKPVHVDGYIVVENKNEYIVDARLSVQLTMPSSRSLEPVEVDLTVPFSEVYFAPNYTPEEEIYSEEDIVIELDSEILDLKKPIEDSILAGLPTQVFTEKELAENKMPKGKNWKVVSETDHLNGDKSDEVNEEDSPFAALKDLFPEDENEEN